MTYHVNVGHTHTHIQKNIISLNLCNILYYEENSQILMSFHIQNNQKRVNTSKTGI